jgi:hypothetical protein
MSESKTTSGGIGLTGMVFCIFLVMKLTGYIDWSWWWVTAPLWLPLTLILGIMGIIALIALLFSK